LLWIYCASSLLFLGAQLVQVLDHPEEPRPGYPVGTNGTAAGAESGKRATAAGELRVD